ncbi:hypothetical protein HN51_007750, partial [Arachis hypogaea]
EELVRFGPFILRRHNIVTLQSLHMLNDCIFEMFALWMSLATGGTDGIEFWTMG